MNPIDAALRVITDAGCIAPPKDVMGKAIVAALDAADIQAEAVPLTSVAKEKLRLEICEWFGRRPNTPWKQSTLKALDRCFPLMPEEFYALKDYYKAPAGPVDYRRKTPETLVNNWAGEIDRAKRWQAENAPKERKPGTF